MRRRGRGGRLFRGWGFRVLCGLRATLRNLVVITTRNREEQDGKQDDGYRANPRVQLPGLWPSGLPPCWGRRDERLLRDLNRWRCLIRICCWPSSRCNSSRQLTPQLLVVRSFLLRYQQADSCRSNLVENLLGECRVLSEFIGPHVNRPLLGSGRNHFPVRLEQFQAQKPVVVWRLVPWRNRQPFVIGVEIGHRSPPSRGLRRQANPVRSILRLRRVFLKSFP